MMNSLVTLYDYEDVAFEIRALEEAEAEIVAGRTISHEAMVKWLRSWGKKSELSPPKYGE